MEDTAPAAKPGGQVRVSVRVANRGKRVEGYRLDVVGSGVVDWAEVVPPQLDVFPGDEATAVVVISPPAGQAAPSGRWPFGIRARSSLDEVSAVAEGELEVGGVFGVQSKLVPVTSSGRWRGRHVVHLSNWGNSALTLRLTASDPDAALGFLVRPAEVQLPVGAQTTSVLQVRGRRPFLRGTPVRVPFTVVGEPAGGPPVPGLVPDPAGRPVLDGALLQKPILSRGVLTLGAVALLLAAGGVAWGVTRPPTAGSAGYVDTVPPDQPKNLHAAATGPSTVNLTWAPQPRVRQWEIRSLQGKNGPVFQVGPADAAQTSSTVQGLPATRESCFQLRALGFGADGPPSEPICATTLAAPPSASPTASVATLPPPVDPTSPAPAASSAAAPVLPVTSVPGESATATATATGGPTSPTPTPVRQTDVPLAGAWTAAAIAYATVDPADPGLQKFVTDLQQRGLSPELIYSGSYPDLKPTTLLAAPAYLVIVGRYPSEAEALRACGTIRPITSFCVPVQPQPT